MPNLFGHRRGPGIQDKVKDTKNFCFMRAKKVAECEKNSTFAGYV